MNHKEIIIHLSGRDRIFKIAKEDNKLLYCEWVQSNGYLVKATIPKDKTVEKTYLKAIR